MKLGNLPIHFVMSRLRKKVFLKVKFLLEVSQSALYGMCKSQPTQRSSCDGPHFLKFLNTIESSLQVQIFKSLKAK